MRLVDILLLRSLEGAQMHIGIDLAWGQKRRSGVAAVDAAGRLVSSASLLTDAEIDGWLTDQGECVTVAVDAPLVVVNPSGQRRAETLIGKAFGRFDASAHTSNLSRPHFNPPRGRVLAERHGWSIDPQHSATAGFPACIEVYPHPGMIGVFGLDRIVKYKKGPVPERRLGFTQLLGLLEGLRTLRLTESPRWQEILEVVEGMPRHVDLDLVEDEIDAIFCAYLAWLWHVERDALHVYGDLANGYIVAPPAPVSSR
jgi:predicted RNase H-like nuclease